MPLPLLFIGLAGATGALGIGKSVKAISDNSTAKSINESANARIKRANTVLSESRSRVSSALSNLGEEKLFVLNNSMSDFLNTFEKIKNVDFAESEGLSELNKLHIDKGTFDALRVSTNNAADFVKSGAAGIAGGALTAFGAYSAATTFAAASTGTAIASLSGAAATNATLAFFGGGSLAAGGLGIAGGTAVLGGLVAGPALMVTGFIAGAKASKNLDNAYANNAESKKIAEQLSAASEMCNAIRSRTYMFYYLLTRLDAYFLPLIYRIEDIVEQEGVDYKVYRPESKKAVSAAASIAGTIKAVLDTPILTENGSLTDESESIVFEVSGAIEKRDDLLI